MRQEGGGAPFARRRTDAIPPGRSHSSRPESADRRVEDEMSTTYTTCADRCAKTTGRTGPMRSSRSGSLFRPWILQFGSGAPAATGDAAIDRGCRGRAQRGLERLGTGRDRVPGGDLGDQPDGFLAGIRQHRAVDLDLYRALGARFRDAFGRGWDHWIVGVLIFLFSISVLSRARHARMVTATAADRPVNRPPGAL